MTRITVEVERLETPRSLAHRRANTRGKRGANELIRRQSAFHDATEPLAFLCECSRPDCYRTVWLAAAAYDRLRRHDELRLLAPAHSPRRPRRRA